MEGDEEEDATQRRLCLIFTNAFDAKKSTLWIKYPSTTRMKMRCVMAYYSCVLCNITVVQKNKLKRRHSFIREV